MPNLKILFYCAKPYSLPVTQSLRELVRNDEKYQSLCFTSPKHLHRFPDDPVTADLTEAVAFNPDIVFCPGNYVHDALSGIKVQLFHGLGYEKRGHFGIRGFFQVYCTPGPLITGRFEKLVQRHKSFIVIETGWPKIDLLFREIPRPDALKTVSEDKKIILYAPTFSRKLTSVPKLITFIEQLPKENEFFVIKIHDLHDKGEKKILQSLPADKFLFIESPDITPWLQVSDLLISDTSSVVYEYALIKDKILLVEPKQKQLLFTQCSASDIREAIDRVLAAPVVENREAREFINTIHPYRDGMSAQRILAKITDPGFVKQVNNLPRKMNLLRKLKLRYYGRFKRGYVK